MTQSGTFFFLRLYLFIFREKGREKERERNIDVQEIHQWVASGTPPTGNLAHNPGMCPDWESNWQPFGSQARSQSTEPHQPGPEWHFRYAGVGDPVVKG